MVLWIAFVGRLTDAVFIGVVVLARPTAASPA